MKRNHFLKSIAAIGVLAVTNPLKLFGEKKEVNDDFVTAIDPHEYRTGLYRWFTPNKAKVISKKEFDRQYPLTEKDELSKFTKFDDGKYNFIITDGVKIPKWVKRTKVYRTKGNQ